VGILDRLRRTLGIAGEKCSLVVRPVPDEANPLWRYFARNKGRVIHKWHHYFDIYHNHFHRFRGRPVTLLEIGVFQGGSLQMWKQYFGPEARICGVDINPDCKQFEEDQIQIFIGDQTDREFISELKNTLGHIDIVIDDGGHTMIQQLTTFRELFPFVGETGIYLVEDLHTSYWEEFGGGYKANGSFVEYAKGFIDSMNAWHSRDPRLVPDSMTRTATGIHFYDSILVIEKYPNGSKPIQSMTGSDSELAAIRKAAERATSSEGNPPGNPRVLPRGSQGGRGEARGRCAWNRLSEVTRNAGEHGRSPLAGWRLKSDDIVPWP